ncbi:MAG: methyltransferase domain-containing protein [Brumimicrobium sp.]
MFEDDPIGYAIHDYLKGGVSQNIIVHSDLSEDDILPSSYLFRSEEEMPQIEQLALKSAEGKVLDVGAAAGAHSTLLTKRGFDVTAIDTSPYAVKHLNNIGIDAEQIDILDLTDKKYDTIFLLMNGIGIAGKISYLTDFLVHCASLLSENGKIICDSTDVRYFFEDNEGAFWVDLNTDYYGEFKFKMKYKEVETPWFNWLYADFETLEKHCLEAGLKIKLLKEDAHAFLVEIKK